MKYLFIFVLLAFSLSACAGASAPGIGKCEKGVCIKMEAVEPILFGQPVTVIVTVTTEKDITGLGVGLSTDYDVVVDGPQGWETYVRDGVVFKGGAAWRVTTKANQPILFTRIIRFPPREQFFLMVFSAGTPSVYVADSLYIHLTLARGTVYYSGTPLPITPFVIVTPSFLTPLPFPTPTRVVVFPPTPTPRPYP